MSANDWTRQARKNTPLVEGMQKCFLVEVTQTEHLRAKVFARAKHKAYVNRVPTIPRINNFNFARIGRIADTILEREKFEAPTPLQQFLLPVLQAGYDAYVAFGNASGFISGVLLALIDNIVNRRAYEPNNDNPEMLVLVHDRYLETLRDKIETYLGGLDSRLTMQCAKSTDEDPGMNCHILLCPPLKLKQVLDKTRRKVSPKYLVVYCPSSAQQQDEIKYDVMEMLGTRDYQLIFCDEAFAGRTEPEPAEKRLHVMNKTHALACRLWSDYPEPDPHSSSRPVQHQYLNPIYLPPPPPPPPRRNNASRGSGIGSGILQIGANSLMGNAAVGNFLQNAQTGMMGGLDVLQQLQGVAASGQQPIFLVHQGGLNQPMLLAAGANLMQLASNSGLALDPSSNFLAGATAGLGQQAASGQLQVSQMSSYEGSQAQLPSSQPPPIAAPVVNQWPPALQNYTTRALAMAKTAQERLAVGEKLKEIVLQAKEANTLWTEDWDNYPLPLLLSDSTGVMAFIPAMPGLPNEQAVSTAAAGQPKPELTAGYHQVGGLSAPPPQVLKLQPSQPQVSTGPPGPMVKAVATGYEGYVQTQVSTGPAGPMVKAVATGYEGYVQTQVSTGPAGPMVKAVATGYEGHGYGSQGSYGPLGGYGGQEVYYSGTKRLMPPQDGPPAKHHAWGA